MDVEHGLGGRAHPGIGPCAGKIVGGFIFEAVRAMRFGFSAVTLPWAELEGALRTGLVEGVIGGTPGLATGPFKDLLAMWVQYNDHFEIWWLMINRPLLASLPEEDRDALRAAARDLGSENFVTAEQVDQQGLETLRQAGVEIVELSDAEIEAFARAAREDVWPEIAEEIGAEAMNRLEAHLGLSQ